MSKVLAEDRDPKVISMGSDIGCYTKGRVKNVGYGYKYRNFDSIICGGGDTGTSMTEL